MSTWLLGYNLRDIRQEILYGVCAIMFYEWYIMWVINMYIMQGVYYVRGMLCISCVPKTQTDVITVLHSEWTIHNPCYISRKWSIIMMHVTWNNSQQLCDNTYNESVLFSDTPLAIIIGVVVGALLGLVVTILIIAFVCVCVRRTPKEG